MLNKIVGDNIRTIRKLKGFSRGELAVRAGFTSSYWGYLERGQKNPSLELVERIAFVLEVEPYMLLVDSPSKGLFSEMTQLLNVINSMGHMHVEFMRDVLISYIKTHK
ncbi:hypothetical protein DCCM_0810 [Desulfocucumis palustris]|uniref:HTH cro/C1-type domain-containing protein n=1 Tax=Desulfocucumis palustris TaxID=1898651 RepID=A0A2L2X9J9_9FIRM|nr:helix-turn-helix transcriptional regulator [Desulfocucumis palustris]GBF32614.1 hypothetical protein DCCM_0810 [Desulfocucumis palustris]